MGAGNAEDCERSLALRKGLSVFRAYDNAEAAGAHPDEEAAWDNRSDHGRDDTGALVVLVAEDMAAGDIAAAEGMVEVDDMAVVVVVVVVVVGMSVAENMPGQGLPAEQWYSSLGPKAVERHRNLAEALVAAARPCRGSQAQEEEPQACP